jgi:uncharacterized membrane protein
MSELIAIAYPDKQTASEVRQTLARLQTEHLIELDDVVVVVKDNDGKVRLDQAVNLTGAGAASGALWGGLIGMLFFAPLLGMAVGAASGALSGKFSDFGVDDNFMQDVGAHLQPGGSAIFVLVRRATPDRVLEEVGRYGGTVLRTSLSRDAEERLQAALSQ